MFGHVFAEEKVLSALTVREDVDTNIASGYFMSCMPVATGQVELVLYMFVSSAFIKNYSEHCNVLHWNEQSGVAWPKFGGIIYRTFFSGSCRMIYLYYKVEPNQEFQGLVCEGANVLPSKFVDDAFPDGHVMQEKVVNIRRLDEVISSINGWYMERGLFGMVSGVGIFLFIFSGDPGSSMGIRVSSEWLDFKRVNARARQGFNVGPMHFLAFDHVVGIFPPHEAFPIGGTNSVRGYEEGALGPGRSYVVEVGKYYSR